MTSIFFSPKACRTTSKLRLLFFGLGLGGAGGGTGGDGHRSGGADAELVLESLDQLGQVEHAHLLDLLDELVFA